MKGKSPWAKPLKEGDKLPCPSCGTPDMVAVRFPPKEKQPCPICACKVDANPRYPAYLCHDCRQRTLASDGRAVHFTNANPQETLPGMSVRAFYRDTAEPYETERCFVAGVECFAREAHFGGVVIQPAEIWIETGQH